MGELEEIKVCIVEETYMDDKTYYRPYVKLFYNVCIGGFCLFRYKVEKSVKYSNTQRKFMLYDTFVRSDVYHSKKNAMNHAQDAIENWKAEMKSNTLKSRKEFEV
jgi:hypothetical protein